MLRFVRFLVGIGLLAILPICSGCGGDAYEQQFNKSLKSLKDTGKPIPRAGEPAPQEAQGQTDQPATK
jgi:hypothetical protein